MIFLLQNTYLELMISMFQKERKVVRDRKSREVLLTTRSGLVVRTLIKIKKSPQKFHTTFFIHILLARNESHGSTWLQGELGTKVIYP